jgi:hypothetical protein
MFRRAAIVAIVLMCIAVSVGSEAQQQATPDTLLVLKNGAEVRGVFVGFKDGEYTLRLSDGRTMSYPAGDVDRMAPISASTSSSEASSAQSAPSSSPISCQTFISEQDVDKALYKAMKDIKVSKKWYGSTSEMYGYLAEKAHKVGADAVINVHTWHAPAGFAWAAPHAGGLAVKWTEAGRKALPSLKGRCY